MSSIASSEHSKDPSFGGYARKLSLKPKPSITIHINNHYRSKVYTTGSEVSGFANIHPQTDVRFDTLQIALLGTTKTRIDAVNIAQSTAHTFLKLTMPIPESSYPIPRILEAGTNYTVPFTFVIPSTLTLNACSHHVSNDSIREHHVRLPPSIGSWEKDDFAPNMSRVQYVIKVRAYRDDESGVGTKVMEAAREIKVLPTVPEDPPLNITKHDELYTMSKSKSLRKTIISPKSGKVTVTAQQPSAAMLSPDGQTISSTTVPLDLEFEPASSGEVKPPKITNISSKITAVTYFSAVGINHYPDLKNSRRTFGTEGRGSYSGTTSASTGATEAVQWSKHSTSQQRRDSGYGSEGPSSSSSCSSDSDHSASTAIATPTKKHSKVHSPIIHTAHLQVPIQVPTHKKAFVPTFHSCIASRVYVLWLTVSLSAGGTTAHVTLNVPLQIGVNGTPGEERATELPPPFQEVEEAEADEYWRPRMIGVPNVDFHRGGDRGDIGILPGYAELGYHSRTVAAH